MPIGIHQSFENPMSNIPLTMKEIGASTFQIFLRNNRNSKRRFISSREVQLYNYSSIISGVTSFAVHAPYIMNLCDPLQHERILPIIQEDLRLMRDMSGSGRMVIHPGSSKYLGEVDAIKNIVSCLSSLTVPYSKGALAIETMAGAGTQMLSTYNQVNWFIYECKCAGLDNVGLCLDTCHLFGAGIDFLEFYDKYAEYVSVIHINGSVGAFGSKVDRHASIRNSQIPVDSIVQLVNDVMAYDASVPIILETPVDVQLGDLLFLKNI